MGCAGRKREAPLRRCTSIVLRISDVSLRDLPKAEIQKCIDRIHWYHEFDFGDGLRAEVKTPDADSHRALWGPPAETPGSRWREQRHIESCRSRRRRTT